MSKHGRRRDRDAAGEYIPATVPKVALLAAIVALVISGVALTILDGKGDRGSREMLEKIMYLVPLLATAFFAERASKDIRNGTVVAKTKEGAKAALEEAGPAIAKAGAAAAIHEEQVMTRTGPAITAELAALTELVLQGRENADAIQSMAANMQSRPTITNPPPT